MTIMSILTEYARVRDTPSDINQHLSILRDYAWNQEHITEMGVRGVISTWALLAGLPQRMISYDIVHVDTSLVAEHAATAGIEYEFRRADVLTMSVIEETDLLFIDTLHTYAQLRGELARHADRVRKNGVIILHDTVTYGHQDEPMYSHASPLARPTYAGKAGLLMAIDEFIDANNKWRIELIRQNNNGLTVLRRD
jgi:predicted O-methyltransferase YrrM